MKVYVEGIPDQQLIFSLQPSLNRKEIIKAGTISKVILKIANEENATGVIDEDPMKPRPKSFKSFIQEKSRRYEIEIYRHPKTNNKLVVLCPRIEDWIIYVCKSSRVNANNYGLNISRFKSEINRRTYNLERLFADLLDRKCPPLLYLQESLAPK